ncbi:hypothetical protein P3H15_47570 [Rhodococcus sp. T2V]|uniref:hypothetical protein n=1 Tax=Rhodococcus sp. T2V TaxID=3034164 RepID=UPI0023E08F18|nr:hypothetical protein [Rhodococcus sp. T2V]MDF3312609.1 hypothetical protein [Rhodococcus sp. T2V]
MSATRGVPAQPDTQKELNSHGVPAGDAKHTRSIVYLSRYPVVEPSEIARTSIADLPGTRTEAIVTTIIAPALAHAFDISVVAEGLETLPSSTARESTYATPLRG